MRKDYFTKCIGALFITLASKKAEDKNEVEMVLMQNKNVSGVAVGTLMLLRG